MPRSRPPYPVEYRHRMVELVRSGRTPESLSREFEPTAQSISNWVRQADLDEGRREDGLTTAEREELRRLDSLHTSVDDLVEERFAEELDFGQSDQPRRRGRPRKHPR